MIFFHPPFSPQQGISQHIILSASCDLRQVTVDQVAEMEGMFGGHMKLCTSPVV